MLRWPYVLQGGNMPTLKAPKQVVFLVSLILAVVAWISVFAGIPYIGGHPSVLLTLAYVVLALGCFLSQVATAQTNATQFTTPFGSQTRQVRLRLPYGSPSTRQRLLRRTALQH
jgi:uncharacterized membrane protein